MGWWAFLTINRSSAQDGGGRNGQLRTGLLGNSRGWDKGTIVAVMDLRSRASCPLCVPSIAQGT